MDSNLKKRALTYHAGPPPGKLSIAPTKPCRTAQDLALAYTPGVAEPCLAIAKDPLDVYRYTSKGNLVAVISNGTRVLGLGDIGPRAAKPVMEGKAILFKRFAGIDVFDLELDTKDPKEFVRTVEVLAPGFGGINLEDIRTPDCFEIERELRARLPIPVFHDDQHGTALIAGAAMINAVVVQEKRLEDLRVVVLGAGAAGIAIAGFMVALGVDPDRLLVCDSQGVLHMGRTDRMNPFKEPWRRRTAARTIEDAVKGADAVIGVAQKGLFTPAMLQLMGPRPIVFALANPEPEIDPDLAKATRKDVLVATGRSDYPNQVNNVLGFPFVFRGALDVAASTINEPMKLAAARALAELARQPVPDEVSRAYEGSSFQFGFDYIIPKPFDPRVLTWVAPAVAKAAMDSGVAHHPIQDMDEYRASLERRFGLRLSIIGELKRRARKMPPRLVFPEGESRTVLMAVDRIVEEGIASPILLGNPARVAKKAEELGLELDVPIVDPVTDPRSEAYAELLFKLRGRRGGSLHGARERVKMTNTFGCLMVRAGDADGIISGAQHGFPETLRAALQIVGVADGIGRVSGIHLVSIDGRLIFLADTSVNIEPDAEQLADIALGTAQLARSFMVEPRVAMLSFSSFGAVGHPSVSKVQRAAMLVKERAPDLVVEGDIAPDVALSPEIVRQDFPQSVLKGDANVLIFPDLSSGNLAYKLLEQLAGARVVGPILVGFKKPVCALPQGTTVENVVDMAAVLGVSSPLRARGPEGVEAVPRTARVGHG